MDIWGDTGPHRDISRQVGNGLERGLDLEVLCTL